MKYTRKAGETNLPVEITFLDSTTGAPETGVNAATPGLEIWYQREGAARVVLASINNLAALTDAHNDEGILHKADGRYRLDLPDAAIAAGVPVCYFGGSATGMVAMGGMIELVALDPFDATSVWKAVLTETVAAVGAAMTAEQLMHEIRGAAVAWSKSGTTTTRKKIDGTVAATYNLDDANQPTSINRAT